MGDSRTYVHAVLHVLSFSVHSDSSEVMPSLVSSHKLQPLWFFKQVSISVMHYMILGRMM